MIHHIKPASYLALITMGVLVTHSAYALERAPTSFDFAIKSNWYSNHINPNNGNSNAFHSTSTTALDRVDLALNLYHGQNIWLNSDTTLANKTLSTPVQTNRVMWDLKPGLFTFRRFSPYPIGGIGVSWNRSSFHERITNSEMSSNSFVNLSTRTHAQVTYDLGFGGRYQIMDHLLASVEYLYTRLGPNVPSAQIDSKEKILASKQHTPESSAYYNQGVVVGLGWQF
jgi:opacity protein-like surface antigen